MTPQDNELLVRVAGRAPMGAMLRANYWFPALISEKLVAGGAPVPVRLLGEDFVAFRAHDGRVGFFNERCPHRGASLRLARNEDNALRCIFHGWKYSVSGEVVEVPTQPTNNAAFCKSVPLKHYPVREAGRIVWVWLGEEPVQPFPDFEFTRLPAAQTYAVRQKVAYNWVQDVEGGMDSAHLAVLHQSWLKSFGDIGAAVEDFAPSYEFEAQPGGFRYAAIRSMKSGSRYIRVNQFVMPWYALICPEKVPDGDRLVIMSTPIDDGNTWHWLIRYNPYQALGPSYANPVEDVDDWPPLPPGPAESAWGQDRTMMAQGHFSGFRHLITEDFVVALSQGTIADRSSEFLSAGDAAVVRLRRMLLDSVREFMAGKRPSLARHEEIPYSRIRAVGNVLAPQEDWRSLAA